MSFTRHYCQAVLNAARQAAVAGLWTAVVLATLLISVTAIYPMTKGYVPVTILTGSMSAGGIEPGDLIFVEEIKDISEVKIGDVVTAMPNQNDTATLVTHRITDIGYGSEGTVVTTKGDSNSLPDAPMPAAAVRAKLVDLSIEPFSTPFVVPKIGGPYLALTKFKTESGIQDAVPFIGWGLIAAGTAYYLGATLLAHARDKRRGKLDAELADAPQRRDELNDALVDGRQEPVGAEVEAVLASS